MIATRTIDDALKVNLSSYLEANVALETSDTSYYRVRRELAIARLALEEGTKTYLAAIDVIKLSIAELSKSVSPDNVHRLLNLMKVVEDKSSRVISAASNVAKTAKSGAEIESLLSSKLDAVQIYSLITQLPTILNQLTLNVLIENGGDDPQSLAAQIANKFNDALTEQVAVLSYRDSTDGDAQGGSNGILEQQVSTMLNSVPHNPARPQVIDAIPSVLKDN